LVSVDGGYSGFDGVSLGEEEETGRGRRGREGEKGELDVSFLPFSLALYRLT